jgi:dienelactone hydrolase
MDGERGSRGGEWPVRPLAALAGIALAVVLPGCLARVHLPFEPAAYRLAERATALPASLGAARPREPPDAGLTFRRHATEYTVWRFSMPSTGDNGQPGRRVTGRYYEHRRAGRRALVIVLPIWGRSGYPPAITVRRITRYGDLNVLALDGARSLFDWPAIAEAPDADAFRALMERSAATFVTTVADIGRLVDWASARGEIDPRRIGITGFSMSAILAATAMGVDDRIGRGVLVMGGGDLPHAFSVCSKRPGRVRERFVERVGWSVERFRRELEPILAPIDPLRFAGAIDPARVLFIDAGRDDCIPREAREELWARMGRPERLTIQSGHRRSFLAMTFLDNFRATKRIARFFRAWPEPAREPVGEVAAGSS